MIRKASIYRIVSDFFTNFSYIVDSFFGGDFFKNIQYSFSEKIFRIKEQVSGRAVENLVPSLIIQIQDFYPFDTFSLNRNLIVTDYTPLKQVICVNETKGEYIEAVNAVWKIPFTVNIGARSTFEAIEIKDYLISLFPIESFTYFPNENYKFVSLIPIFDYKNLLPNWDFGKDEIYYYYIKTEDISGRDNVLLLPYEFQVLLRVNDVSKSQDKNVVDQTEYSLNTLSFEAVVEFPQYLILNSSIEIKKLEWVLKPLPDYIPLPVTTYTPIEILKRADRKMDFVFSTYVTKGNATSENNEVIKISFSSQFEGNIIYLKAGDVLLSSLNNDGIKDFKVKKSNSGTYVYNFSIEKARLPSSLIDGFKNKKYRFDCHVFNSSS